MFFGLSLSYLNKDDIFFSITCYFYDAPLPFKVSEKYACDEGKAIFLKSL